jgi:hypothetical protein
LATIAFRPSRVQVCAWAGIAVMTSAAVAAKTVLNMGLPFVPNIVLRQHADGHDTSLRVGFSVGLGWGGDNPYVHRGRVRAQSLEQSHDTLRALRGDGFTFNEDLSIGEQRCTTVRHNINALCFRRDSVVRCLAYGPRIP